MSFIQDLKTRFKERRYLPTLTVERNGRSFHVRATFDLTEKMIDKIVSGAEKCNVFKDCYVTVTSKKAPEQESDDIEFVCHNGDF